MPTCPDGHQSTSADFCDTCGMRIEGAPPQAPAAAGDPADPGNPCPQCGTEKTGQFCEVCGFDFATGTPAPPPSEAPAPLAADPAGQPYAAAPGDPGTAADPGAADPGAADPGAADPGAADPGAASASMVTGAGEIGTNPAAGRATMMPAGPSWTAMVTADRDYYDAVIADGGPDADSIEFPAYCPERRFTLAGQEMRIGRRSASRGLDPEIDLTGPPTDPGISHLHAVLIAQPDGTWSVLDPGSSNGTQVNGDDIVSGVETPLHSGDRVCVGAWTVLTIQAP